MSAVRSLVEVEVGKDELARELGFVLSSSEKRTTIPILSMVRLELRDGFLFITATDLDCAAQSKIQVEAGIEAGVCVDLKRFYSLVKGASATSILLGFGDEKLTLKAGRSNYTLNGREVDDFPDAKVYEGERIDLPAAGLRQIIQATKNNISLDESRFALAAIRLAGSASSLTAYSCDSYCLAIASIPVSLSQEFDLLLIKPIFQPLSRLLDMSGEKVTCVISENSLAFEANGRWISGRASTGQFPNTDKVLGAEFQRLGELPVKDWQDALLRIVNVGNEVEANNKVIRLDFKPDALEVTASADVGRGAEVISGTFEPYARNFNAVFLLRGLNTLSSESVHLSVSSETVLQMSTSWSVGENCNLDFRFIVNGRRD